VIKSKQMLNIYCYANCKEFE